MYRTLFLSVFLSLARCLSLSLSAGQITAEVSIPELRLYPPVMSLRLCFRSASPCRAWWTALKINVTWIKTALLTLQRLLLMNRSLRWGGGGRQFGVARGLSVAGLGGSGGGLSECPPPHCSYSASTFQISLIHNGTIRISVLHLQLTVLVFSFFSLFLFLLSFFVVPP